MGKSKELQIIRVFAEPNEEDRKELEDLFKFLIDLIIKDRLKKQENKGLPLL